ncbi:hypothetical protein Tco_0966798 [Tanacetum coccineum]
MKLKKGHIDISKSVRRDLFKSWVTSRFTGALDPNKDPLERCFDEYKWVFHREIEQLADEYQIKIREKRQILNDIWAKCKRVQGKNKDWWYDYWYEDEEKMELGDEDYNPPIVHTETFDVTKYKFNNSSWDNLGFTNLYYPRSGSLPDSALSGRKVHLLEEKQISSVGVFDEVTWMTFGGNTRDLGSFGEETDEITDLHQIHKEILFLKSGDGVAGIKRRRRDPFSDGVRDLVTASGLGRLNEDLESST